VARITSRNSKMTKFLYAILLVVAVIAVFIRSTAFQFVNLDDVDYVTQNPHVMGGLSPENIAWAFTSFHAANWHPVTWISHMIDSQLFGLNPWGHHLVSVLLHTANTLLLFFLLSRLSGTLWKCAFAAALFAIHPLHVESVAWVSERKDVLSTMFLLLTLAAYANYVQLRTFRYYCLALLAFALGLMSKPMLVTVPFLLLLMDYWPLGRFTERNSSSDDSVSDQPLIPPSSTWSILKEKIPFLILSMASCIITVLAQSSLAVISLEELPFSLRAANALVAYSAYIGNMFWPFNLGAYYPFSGVLPLWKVMGASILLLSISMLALKNIKRYPYLAFGWFWYVVTLVPVIGLVQVGAQSMADRYTYIPMIGLFIAIVWGIHDLAETAGATRLVRAGAAILVLILSVISYRQVGYWKDSEAVFGRALEVTNDNWFAHSLYGVALDEQGKYAQALPHFIKSVQINPNYSKSRYSLGIALKRVGRLDEAIVNYRAAIKIDPGFVAARNNLATALTAKGNFDEAIVLLQQIVQLQPDNVMYRNNLAHALDKKGFLNEALVQYLEALRLDPNSALNHRNIGSVYHRLGRFEEASLHLANAARLDPSQTTN